MPAIVNRSSRFHVTITRNHEWHSRRQEKLHNSSCSERLVPRTIYIDIYTITCFHLMSLLHNYCHSNLDQSFHILCTYNVMIITNDSLVTFIKILLTDTHIISQCHCNRCDIYINNQHTLNMRTLCSNAHSWKTTINASFRAHYGINSTYQGRVCTIDSRQAHQDD